MKSTLFLSLFFCLPMFGQTSEAKKANPSQAYKVAPSFFVPNLQKTGKRLLENPNVTAFVQTQSGRVLFTPSGAFFDLSAGPADLSRYPNLRDNRPLEKTPDASPQQVVLKAGFSKAHAQKRGILPRVEEVSQAKVNYLVGNRQDWQTNLPTYKKLIYDDVWEGITLEFLGFMDRLEYRWLLDPHSDPSIIVMETGAQSLKVNAEGDLVATLDGGFLKFKKPLAYQIVAGQRKDVSVAYVAQEQGRFSFSLGTYDTKEALVIDPELIWSTLLGGPGQQFTEEALTGVAIDSSDNVYLTGSSSDGFPTTPGVYQPVRSGRVNVFVAKLNPTGTDLVYATYLGGTGFDRGGDIQVDSSGCAYVSGTTSSEDFPTTSGAFVENLTRETDIFVTKLNSTGTALIYSTLLNTPPGNIHHMALDTDGKVYVTDLNRGDFTPTSGAFDETANGANDIFVLCLNSTGTGLHYATLVGGSQYENPSDIAVDGSGCAYVTGSSTSSNFPTTLGAFDRTYSAGDAVVFKLNPSGTDLVYSTFLGGSSSDQGLAIAVDASGNAYVAGDTHSSDFPTTAGAFSAIGDGSFDLFVCKLATDGSSQVYSTFIGDSYIGSRVDIAVDPSGAAFLTGYTSSTDFPTTPGALTEETAESAGFALKLNSTGSGLIYSTFLQLASPVGLVLNSAANAVVAGIASPGFQTTPGAYSEVVKGIGDFFVASLNNDGSALTYSTLIGTYDGEDAGRVVKLALDPNDHPIILSASGDSGYPTTPGTYSPANNGWHDIVLTKLNADGSGLIFSTFFGGNFMEEAFDLAVDGSGAIYVAGHTYSHNFPTTPNAYLDQLDNRYTFFVTKFNSDASDLVYSTLIGESSPSSEINDLFVDSTGHCFLTGKTAGSSFPVTSGTLNNSFVDFSTFLTKLNPTGSDLDFSTFLPNRYILPSSLSVDNSGTIYLLATTYQSGLPVTNDAFDTTLSGSSDLFLMKINATASALLYASYFGGSEDEDALSLVVDPQGAMYFTAQTLSSDFPTTSGAFQESYHGETDITISKLNPEGTALTYSTYLGGSLREYHDGFAVDSSGAAYVLGLTQSADFPVLSGTMSQTGPWPSEIFITRLNQTGSGVTYSRFLGAQELPFNYFRTGGLVLDSTNKIIAAGTTDQRDFPTSDGAYQDRLQGDWDLYLFKMDLCVPYAPEPIAGASTVCQNETGIVYSIPGLTDATGYTWTVPEGASISAGQGTPSITVNFGTSSGEISVTADYPCGPSTPQILAITVDAPIDTPEISGEALVCAEQTGLTYSIAALSGSSNTLWIVPEGASIRSGQGTSSITVDFGQVAGDVTVQVQNACGQSNLGSLGVSIADPIQILSTYNAMELCADDVLEVTVAASGSEPTYQWLKDELPLVDDKRISGAQTATLHIQALSQADEGSYSCEVSNPCGLETSTSFPLTVSGLDVSVSPPVAVQGLEPVTFEATPSCAQGDVTYQWTNLETSEVFHTNPITLTVDRTTELELQVSDESGNLAQQSLWILSPSSGVLDLNGDGFNTIEDLLSILPEWSNESLMDLNGDGIVNILDLLYINIGQ